MNLAICVGGPYDGRKLAHTGNTYRLALEPHRFGLHRAIPGMVDSTGTEIQFGEYHFGDGLWTWQDPTADAA